MTTLHLLGFPRIGAKRELKTLLENYWKNEIDETALLGGARELRQRHWLLQKAPAWNCHRLAISPSTIMCWTRSCWWARCRRASASTRRN